MTPLAIRRMAGSRLLPLLAYTLLGCGPASRTGSDDARFIVTARPLDLGIGTPPLCVAVDPSDPHGVWWWHPGQSGCDSRSTGPGVFAAHHAAVSRSSRSPAITASFRLQLHSTTRPFVEIELVVEEGTMRAVASGARVSVLQRSDLDVPEGW